MMLLNTICACDTKLEEAVNMLDDRIKDWGNKDKVIFIKKKKTNCIAIVQE